MGARSRRKGAQWERDVANLLGAALGQPCKRNLEEVRSGNSGDIVLPAHVPFSVQCKVGARPPIYDAIQEAREAAREGQTPLAIVRRNGTSRRPPDDLVVMPLEAFVAMLAQLHGAR